MRFGGETDFGDSRLGPVLFMAVGLAFVGDGLNGGPSEDRIVTDKGSNVAIGDSVSDLRVDEVCEEGDSAFEKAIRHLFVLWSVTARHSSGVGRRTFITPDENWMIATSGECSISLTASSRQSVGTRVSESTIRM